MIDRLWYPQLDVYDTARRMIVLLQSFVSPPGIERLCIADFFLANPPLLHETTMSMNMRRAFRSLEIPRRNNVFLSYPSAPLLFQKMESVQREAILALSGRELISEEAIDTTGKVSLTHPGRNMFETSKICSTFELALSQFLAQDFASKEELGNDDLRRRTGLRRAS